MYNNLLGYKSNLSNYYMRESRPFKSLLPTYPLPPFIKKKIGCCDRFDYTKKHYHPHCCPGKRHDSGSCSDHDYPGHFSSVVHYDKDKDSCDRHLPYQYYHYKKTVKSEYPWTIHHEPPKQHFTKGVKHYQHFHIPNYNKTGCACGK